LKPAVAAMIPANREIEITVRAQIDSTGRVVIAEAIHNRIPKSESALYAQLEAAAVEATKQWRFEPGRSANTPVASDYSIGFLFRKR
jgi:hypothetical protein